MHAVARGEFNVDLQQLDMHEEAPSPPLGLSSIYKTYRGELQAVSHGEMLSAVTEVQGSMAYVAIELVTGILREHRGSFLLQHTGVMVRGSGRLTVDIVPDSGTEELAGITGSMTIEIRDGAHFYELSYELPVE